MVPLVVALNLITPNSKAINLMDTNPNKPKTVIWDLYSNFIDPIFLFFNLTNLF